MAFTRAPVMDSHNTVRLPAGGSQFVITNESVQFPATLNYIDCFPLSETQWGTDPKRRIHKRDAFKTLATFTLTTAAFGSVGPTQNVVSNSLGTGTGQIYFLVSEAAQSRAYRVNLLLGLSPTLTDLGTVTQSAYKTGTAARNANQEWCACWVNGTHIAIYNETVPGLSETVITPTIDGRKGIVFLDGYLFGVDNTTGNKIYNSAAGGTLTTWNSTDFTTAETFPDGISYIAKHHNYLVAFGVSSIEFFYDAGNAVGSPLTRQETYTSKIGLVPFYTTSLGLWTKQIAVDGDDIYFLGTNETNQIGLYRIRNFRVENLDNQYLQNVLAYPPSSPIGIETLIINNNPQIRIIVKNNVTQVIAPSNVVYMPQEDTWWQMTNADYTVDEIRTTNTMFSPTFTDSTTAIRPVYLEFASSPSTTLLLRTPDFESVVSNTATIYTPIADFGTNFYKHFARVDAIGDFGNNTLTLSYSPNPRYLNYISCGAKIPSAGFTENLSWYNLGAFRRPSLQWTFTGLGPSIYEATEVTYNVGTA